MVIIIKRKTKLVEKRTTRDLTKGKSANYKWKIFNTELFMLGYLWFAIFPSEQSVQFFPPTYYGILTKKGGSLFSIKPLFNVNMLPSFILFQYFNKFPIRLFVIFKKKCDFDAHRAYLMIAVNRLRRWKMKIIFGQNFNSKITIKLINYENMNGTVTMCVFSFSIRFFFFFFPFSCHSWLNGFIMADAWTLNIITIIYHDYLLLLLFELKTREF